MPNKNYIRGRSFEYKVKKRWSEGQFKALRTAGSHGEFDIIAYKRQGYDCGPEGREVYQKGDTYEEVGKYIYKTFVTPIIGYGIQCKVLKNRKVKRVSR